MSDNIEQKIEELEKQLDDRNSSNNSRPISKTLSKIVDLFSKLNQKILDSNGFMTKKGKYLCKSEWHAVAIPAGMISGAYMLPQPLGLLTFLSYLFMNKKGFDLLQSDYKGHWNDVMEEYAYAAASFAITIAYWTYLTQETVDGAGEINSAIISLFAGA